MALTPSRTRNQTTLNNLAKMLASLNGEHGFCVGLIETGDLDSADADRLHEHVAVLETKRAALRITLLQFDPKLDVDSIRGLDTWQKRFGGKRVSGRTLKRRLVAEVMVGYDPSVPPSRDELPYRQLSPLWGQKGDTSQMAVVRPRAGC